MFKYLIISLFIVPQFAFANVIWPGLILGQKLISLLIPISIIIESLIIKFYFKEKILKSLWVSFVMNLISTLCGVISVALGGLVFELSLGIIINKVFNIGTFNIFHWTFVIIISFMVSAIVEYFSVKKIFKYPVDRKFLYWLILINFVTSMMAAYFPKTWISL